MPIVRGVEFVATNSSAIRNVVRRRTGPEIERELILPYVHVFEVPRRLRDLGLIEAGIIDQSRIPFDLWVLACVVLEQITSLESRDALRTSEIMEESEPPPAHPALILNLKNA